MKKLYFLTFFFLIRTTLFAQIKGTVPEAYKLPKGRDRRIALVVGNQNYSATCFKLTTPINNAEDIANTLQKLGFDVILCKDFSTNELLRAMDDFKIKLKQYNVGLFYYSGYSVRFNGDDYLMPINTQLNDTDELEDSCVKLGRIMSIMEEEKLQTSLFFLDSFGIDPSTFGNHISSSLYVPNNPTGSIFATSIKSKILANTGNRNSLFTEELLRNFPQANVGLRVMLDNASSATEKRSNRNELPRRYDELKGDFYFLISNEGETEKETIQAPMVLINEGKSALNKPKSKKELLSYEPEMVFVAGGSFEMGSNEGYDNEKPVHRVKLGDYYIGKYEVTQAQWEKVMENNPSEFKGCANCPVENVSWDDIQVYLHKLNKQTGKSYRLPTEAEWEYAARGGKASEGYDYAGGRMAKNVGWIGSNSDSKTHEVGTKKMNELGIYDMSGNVWEWCNDWYRAYGSTNRRNQTKTNIGNYRVLRGGCWHDFAGYSRYSRVAHRYSSHPQDRDSGYGFRVVLNP